MPLPKVLKDMLALPTAAFVEQAVLDYIRAACAKMPGVQCTADRWGNLLAHYRNPAGSASGGAGRAGAGARSSARRGPSARDTGRNAGRSVPLCFSAHTDHPGFVALEMLDRRVLRAAFRGGVFKNYFPGERVRFWSADGAEKPAAGRRDRRRPAGGTSLRAQRSGRSGPAGRWIKGRVEAVTKTKEIYRLIGKMELPDEVRIRVAEPVAANSPGMWDLTDPVLRGDLVHARGCDDVAGAAALVALLERLSRKRAEAEAYCLFTRAEEVGFVGAIAAARSRTLPKRVPIVAIETSSDRGGNATIGDGPVLRVGDKASVFTPELTRYCRQVAEKLQSRGRGGGRRAAQRQAFRYQRKLMAGGTCESTAFIAYGYQATGICLALGNYHNMDVERKKIAAEYISLRDWNWMVDWFEALALNSPGYQGRKDRALRDEMESRFKEWQPLLTAG